MSTANSMWAARFYGPGQALRYEQTPFPRPADGEALLRVRASGVCHTELHLLDGVLNLGVVPLTPGHEVVGDFVETRGPNPFRPGQRVLMSYYSPCGSCALCRSGAENLCPNSARQLGFSADGGYAQYVVAPMKSLVALPDSLSDAESVGLACGGATALHAARAVANVKLGETVVVYGVGGVGFYLIQVCRLAGARVLAIGRAASKLTLARDLGADAVVDASTVDPLTAIFDLTNGDGADVVFDLVASSETMDLAPRMLARRGRLVFAGYGDASLRLNPLLLVLREIQIRGAVGNTMAELVETVDLASQGRLRSVVGPVFPLAKANDVLDALRAGKILGRAVLLPNGDLANGASKGAEAASPQITPEDAPDSPTKMNCSGVGIVIPSRGEESRSGPRPGSLAAARDDSLFGTTLISFSQVGQLPSGAREGTRTIGPDLAVAEPLTLTLSRGERGSDALSGRGDTLPLPAERGDDPPLPAGRGRPQPGEGAPNLARPLTPRPAVVSPRRIVRPSKPLAPQPGPRPFEAELLDLIGRGVDAPASDDEFNSLALGLFAYQYSRNEPYRRFGETRRRSPANVEHWTEIPAVPISAFKMADLACEPIDQAAALFMSSGTTRPEQRSRHFHPDLAVYDASTTTNFVAHVLPDLSAGDRRLPFFVLNPRPSALPNSSLAYYLGLMLRRHGADESDYFVDDGGIDYERFLTAIGGAIGADRPVCVLGTTFAFVHLLDRFSDEGISFELPPGSRVFDTGGVKGRSREIGRDEMTVGIASRLGVPHERQVNMYGLTELSTQFIDGNLRNLAQGDRPDFSKTIPPWARTRVLDPETLEELPLGSPGVLCHLDLANRASVSAVLTEDLGVATSQGLEILGRVNGSEARGCSIAMDELLTALDRRS